MSDCLESLFQGVDILIDKKLETISYDSTLICTVVDDSRKKDGVYKVSDGNVIYTAYSESDKYSNKEQVRVSILNGDYSEKKFITGKYDIDSDSAPITYVSPLDSVLNISGNLVNLKDVKGITANNKGEPKKILWSVSLKNKDYIQLQKDGIYDSIILKADFKTFLYNYNLVSGSYGLRVDLLIKPNPNSTSYIRRWAELDSSEMFGNPYSFSIYSTQAKIIKLDTFGVVDSVVLSLYQNNDFKNSDEQYIEQGRTNNILVKNIVLGFGSDLSNKEDNLLELYTTSDTTYKYANYTTETNRKIMGLLWYNKDDYDQYIGFSDGLYDENYDEINYLKESRLDSRLTCRIGRENLPVDEQGLTLSANIDEAIPLIKKACNIIDSDIYQLLLQFQGQFESKSSCYSDINILLKGNPEGTIRAFDKILQEALESVPKLETLYYKALAYSYHFQVNKTHKNELWPTDTTNYGKIIKDNIMGLVSSIEGLLKKIQNTIVSDKSQSHYLSVWDTYNYRIQKLLVNVKEQLGEIETGYTQRFPVDVLNGNDYNKLMKYQGSNDLRAAYNAQDLTPYDNKYCIYWYRYNKGYIQPTDEEGIMPNDWERITSLNNVGLPGRQKQKSPEDGKFYYEKKPLPNEGLVTRDMQHDLQQEKYVVVLFYNHNRIQSKELVFTNADTVPDKFSLDKRDILAFEHIKNSFDDYLIYGPTNYLVNSTEANWTRQLRCHYDGLLAKDEAMVSAGIYWYVPKNSTMLVVDKDELINTYGFVTDADATTKPSYSREGYDCYYKQIQATKKDGVWVYRKIAEGETEKDYEWDNRDFFYKIKEYYDHSALQNSIFCVVNPIGDPDPVEGEKFFSFGIKSTCGTKYTLSITNRSVRDITTTSTSPLDLKVDLKDADNKTIPIYIGGTSEQGVAQDFQADMLMVETDGSVLKKPASGQVQGITIQTGTCGILKASAKITLQETDIYNPEEANLKELADGTLVDKDDNNIVIKDKKSTRDVTLEVVKSIPWSDGNYYIRGPFQIIYNSMGTLDNTSMFDVSYTLFNKITEEEITDNIRWLIKYYDANGNDLEKNSDPKTVQFYKKYLPILNSNGELVPAPLFVNNLEYFPVVIAERKNVENKWNPVWKQPIIILQNRYSSSLLNDWDGSFTIDETNGTIMATMIGVGEKTNNNAFSGVLMGCVSNVAGADIAYSEPNLGLANQSGIGLYGFHEGAQSFCFNVDGTAFLGKSGGGRIIFDGNVGVLASAEWFASYEDMDGNLIEGGKVERAKGITQTSTRGMCIDLQRGHIDAYNFRLSSENIYFNSNPLWGSDSDMLGSEYYMRIGPYPDSFIGLDKNNNLEIRVNSFFMTGTIGGINLLRQTSPRELTPNPYDSEFQEVIEATETVTVKPSETPGEDPIIEVKLDKKYDSIKSQFSTYLNETDNTVRLTWTTEKWSPLGLITGVAAEFSDKPYQLKFPSTKVSQTMGLWVDTFTLSGWVKKTNDMTISFTGSTMEIKYAKVDGNKNVDKANSESELYVKNGGCVLATNDDEWHYFEITFDLINDVTEINFNCLSETYLWHLKLEAGTVATAWSPAPEDVEQNTQLSVQNLDYYLAQDVLFDKLFTDPRTGQKMDGISLVPADKTLSGRQELYINATYIATGILRSANWDGRIKAVFDETGGTYDLDLSIPPSQGMYLNLNEGKVWAANFELTALHKNAATLNKEGIYINSSPNFGEKYLFVGDEEFFIQLTRVDGSFVDLTIDAWDHTNKKGAIIRNNPTVGQHYLRIGDEEQGIRFWREDENTDSFRIDANKFTLKTDNIYLSDTPATFSINGTNRNVVLRMGDNFGVSKDGILYSQGAIISGTLTAGAGSAIGGWTIYSDRIEGGSLQLYNTGQIKNTSNNFNVTSGGTLTATGATLSDLTITGTFNLTPTGNANLTGDIIINGKCTIGSASQLADSDKKLYVAADTQVSGNLYLGTSGATRIYANANTDTCIYFDANQIYMAGESLGIAASNIYLGKRPDGNGPTTSTTFCKGDFKYDAKIYCMKDGAYKAGVSGDYSIKVGVFKSKTLTFEQGILIGIDGKDGENTEGTISWSSISDKPSRFAPESHQHKIYYTTDTIDGKTVVTSITSSASGAQTGYTRFNT